MSTQLINWTDKVDTPEILKYVSLFGSETVLTSKEINQIRDAINNLDSRIIVSGFRGYIDLESVITAIGFYFPTQNGIYGGSIEVNLSEGMTILLFDGESITKQVIPIELESYFKKTDVENSLENSSSEKALSASSGKLLSEKISLVNKAGVNQGVVTDVIYPQITIYGNNVLGARNQQGWYKGISKKIINKIQIPIVRDFAGGNVFTDGLIFRIAINGVFFYTKEITLEEINAGGYNIWSDGMPVKEAFLSIDLPIFELNTNDILYVGVMCKNASDTIAPAYTTVFQNEWIEGAWQSNNVDISVLDTAPAKVIDGSLAYSMIFSYEDFIQKKIDNSNNEIISEFNSKIQVFQKVGEEQFVKLLKIDPPLMVWKDSSILDQRGYQTWYSGIEKKIVNFITVPLIRRISDNLTFTDGVILRIGVNGVYLFTKEITLAEIVAGGYNQMNASTPNENFLYSCDIPSIEINSGDVIFIGMICKNPADKMGFGYTQDESDEWGSLKFSVTDDNLANASVIPEEPSSSGSFSISVKFGFNDYVQFKIDRSMENIPILKKYIDIAYSRKAIGSFLSKLRAHENLKVICYGDSITQFQDSETLSISDQRINPIGLAAESWVRKLWKLLNYNTSDLSFKRFDHSDFSFSNGTQTTSSPIGANGWATNMNGAEGWRSESGGGVYAQSIMPASSYNKPLAGTNKANESFSVSIPESATSVSIIFVSVPANLMAEIKINNGSDIVNETVNLNPSGNLPTEFRKTYNFPAGTVKTLTVKNINASAMWIWGIEYQSINSVKVINSGSGGYHIDLLKTDGQFNPQVKNYNSDLVVFEVCSSNDSNFEWTLPEHFQKAKTLFDKLKLLGVPVLVILTHRFSTAMIDRENVSDENKKLVKFIPETIKNYKALAYENGFAIIDMFSKSVDDLGKTNVVVPPVGYLIDSGHLDYLGNESYESELNKLFLTDDFI